MAMHAVHEFLGELGADAAVYQVIELLGPVVDAMPVEERMVLCNMAVEMGAKVAYVQPDQKTIDYIGERTDDTFKIYETDSDFRFDSEHTYDIENLEPLAAVPHNVDNVKAIAEVGAIPIDQVFTGSCTGGKLTDLEAAAGILNGKRIVSNPGQFLWWAEILAVAPAGNRRLSR
jgi:3-isopropylmalate/(R)-2-methylmalate dehydratase large subunit